MLKNFIKKQLGVDISLKTYNVGLLQAKAYRILKLHTSQSLSEFEITTVEWATLGMLFEAKNGLRFGDIAKAAGVKAPFITQLITKLERKSLVKRISDKHDRRVTYAVLTSEGRALVSRVEKHVAARSKTLLGNVSPKDVLGYLRVLQVLAKHTDEIEGQSD